MLATPLTKKPTPDLDSALGMNGEKEYRRLLRVLRMARGQFFLFPVECDFSPRLRDALLARLSTDLKAEGSCLRVVTLTRDNWDMFALPEMQTPVATGEVVALVGLEDTPGITPEAGAPPRRPPALALLNLQRDGFRTCLPAPFLVWCPPYAYNALLEHAPDFFDHYSGLFHFMNVVPEPWPADLWATPPIDEPFEIEISEGTGSPTLVDFHRRQVEANPTPSSERARALLGLADALWELRDVEWSHRLLEVQEYLEEALRWLARRRNRSDRYDWARGKNNFGLVLNDLPTGNLKENLRRAIACYKAALHVYTEEDYPYEWAATQFNLGNAYTDLSTGDSDENLRRAIACYEAALRVRTEKDTPDSWARTLINLGNAYTDLSTGDSDENLRRAIACYEAALRVYTEEDYPYEWSGIQNNLGLAYSVSSLSDRGENLRLATACYEAALRVRTENDYPVDWAFTKFSLALTLRKQRRMSEALRHAQQAAHGFHACGMEEYAQKAEVLAQDILASEDRAFSTMPNPLTGQNALQG